MHHLEYYENALPNFIVFCVRVRVATTAHVAMASSPVKKKRKIRNHDLMSLKVLEGAAVSDAKAEAPDHEDADELWFFQLPKDVSTVAHSSASCSMQLSSFSLAQLALLWGYCSHTVVLAVATL